MAFGMFVHSMTGNTFVITVNTQCDLWLRDDVNDEEEEEERERMVSCTSCNVYVKQHWICYYYVYVQNIKHAKKNACTMCFSTLIPI